MWRWSCLLVVSGRSCGSEGMRFCSKERASSIGALAATCGIQLNTALVCVSRHSESFLQTHWPIGLEFWALLCLVVLVR
uniref:Uncharacterized protein n=1 Tax=Cannabis sativa TaxID=3483 RepID=A0A803NLC4_CANSA